MDKYIWRMFSAFLAFSALCLAGCGGGGGELVVSPLRMEASGSTYEGDRNDSVTFVAEMEVTSRGGDVYLPVNPAMGVRYRLEDANGVEVPIIGTRSVTVTSTASEMGGYYRITEGEKVMVTIVVTYTPGVQNTAVRFQLVSLLYNDVLAAPTMVWDAEPAADYRTALKTVIN